MAEWENANGGPDDYFTPPEIFEALGVHVDLDPCGHRLAYVPAGTLYITRGLERDWKGTVWMNPPFGRRNGVVPWLEKFIEHGNGIGLVRAYTSAGWFHDLIPQMDSILFPRGKTKFIRPDGTVAKQPGHGVVLFSKGYGMTTALRKSGLGFFTESWEIAESRDGSTLEN